MHGISLGSIPVVKLSGYVMIICVCGKFGVDENRVSRVTIGDDHEPNSRRPV
jgi:hypothetical protein